MWLGLSPLLDEVACQEVLVLGACVAVSESARDLGVVINRELSSQPSASLATTCYASSDQ